MRHVTGLGLISNGAFISVKTGQPTQSDTISKISVIPHKAVEITVTKLGKAYYLEIVENKLTAREKLSVFGSQTMIPGRYLLDATLVN